MDEDDKMAVSGILGESPERLRDDHMVSLVADWSGQIIAVLRGWLGHPYGHVEMFDVDWHAPPKRRVVASLWLIRTFEALCHSVGASGWTAQTAIRNAPMIRLLKFHVGAQMLPEVSQVFVKRWS